MSTTRKIDKNKNSITLQTATSHDCKAQKKTLAGCSQADPLNPRLNEWIAQQAASPSSFPSTSNNSSTTVMSQTANSSTTSACSSVNGKESSGKSDTTDLTIESLGTVRGLQNGSGYSTHSGGGGFQSQNNSNSAIFGQRNWLEEAKTDRYKSSDFASSYTPFSRSTWSPSSSSHSNQSFSYRDSYSSFSSRADGDVFDQNMASDEDETNKIASPDFGSTNTLTEEPVEVSSPPNNTVNNRGGSSFRGHYRNIGNRFFHTSFGGQSDVSTIKSDTPRAYSATMSRSSEPTRGGSSHLRGGKFGSCHERWRKEEEEKREAQLRELRQQTRRRENERLFFGYDRRYTRRPRINDEWLRRHNIFSSRKDFARRYSRPSTCNETRRGFRSRRSRSESGLPRRRNSFSDDEAEAFEPVPMNRRTRPSSVLNSTESHSTKQTSSPNSTMRPPTTRFNGFNTSDRSTSTTPKIDEERNSNFGPPEPRIYPTLGENNVADPSSSTARRSNSSTATRIHEWISEQEGLLQSSRRSSSSSHFGLASIPEKPRMASNLPTHDRVVECNEDQRRVPIFLSAGFSRGGSRIGHSTPSVTAAGSTCSSIVNGSGRSESTEVTVESLGTVRGIGARGARGLSQNMFRGRGGFGFGDRPTTTRQDDYNNGFGGNKENEAVYHGIRGNRRSSTARFLGDEGRHSFGERPTATRQDNSNNGFGGFGWNQENGTVYNSVRGNLRSLRACFAENEGRHSPRRDRSRNNVEHTRRPRRASVFDNQRRGFRHRSRSEGSLLRASEEYDDDFGILNLGPPPDQDRVCDNCRENHRTFECPIKTCFKCRSFIDNWRVSYKIHPKLCDDLVRGFMRPDFEPRKNKFYFENKHQLYQELSPEMMRMFYELLEGLTPANEYGFGVRFHEKILRNIEVFGNFGGRSLVLAHDLLWRKLSATEAFEFELFDLRIEPARVNINIGSSNFRPFDLTFNIRDKGENKELNSEQSYLRRELNHNGVYGFPIIICIREESTSIQDHEFDADWPDDLPRKKVSMIRLNATAYRCQPPSTSEYCTLTIDPLKDLRPFLNYGYVPKGKIFLAFNHRANRMREETKKMRDFIDSPNDRETFPKNLKEMVSNFYNPKIEDQKIFSDVKRNDLEKFNDLLPKPYRLMPEQMGHAINAYEYEMHAILGPSGTGKTTIFCFLAIYNWFALRRKTLLLTTRRGAANEITLRIVRMSKFLLELPQFRHLNNERQYIWYKLEKDSAMEPRDPEIEEVCSFSHEVPEQITMLVAIHNFLTADVVLQFKADSVLLDEASSVSTLNFYTHLVMLNEKKRHVPQHMSIFGDQFQLNARFSKEPFLTDGDEMRSGYDESALVQLLKCNLPSTQMKQIVRTPKALCKIIQPFYDFTLHTALCPPDRPLLLDFAGCFNLISDLLKIEKRQFVSLFINLPRTDPQKHHFCDADDHKCPRRLHHGSSHEVTDRRLCLTNRRNVFYASHIFNAILKNNPDISSEDCLYLTPYRVQESEFYHRRTKPGATGAIRGQTVDRAISTDAPFVLLDLVRTGPYGFMNGHAEEWPAYDTAKRLLVSLSRATRAQIIIGSVDLFHVKNLASRPIDRLAKYHLKSRDPLVSLIELGRSSDSKGNFDKYI
ncbi:unnamed protein product [Bursaphelenchus xylophilus]|uniref:(pine wood nematode) hypothetical protein n=1 Tax=Bursaphelenchus xylophilus TaxID=6326 RepID=A0A7I8XGE7_BURXY|nr:unnamed protein product [Bursaphelenchus xylophilus]CAG9081525.1 unnamed protein product [Bursaphelenchus xylophilus]